MHSFQLLQDSLNAGRGPWGRLQRLSTQSALHWLIIVCLSAISQLYFVTISLKKPINIADTTILEHVNRRSQKHEPQDLLSFSIKGVKCLDIRRERLLTWLVVFHFLEVIILRFELLPDELSVWAPVPIHNSCETVELVLIWDRPLSGVRID